MDPAVGTADMLVLNRLKYGRIEAFQPQPERMFKDLLLDPSYILFPMGSPIRLEEVSVEL
jgi:hypothetical protein